VINLETDGNTLSSSYCFAPYCQAIRQVLPTDDLLYHLDTCRRIYHSPHSAYLYIAHKINPCMPLTIKQKMSLNMSLTKMTQHTNNINYYQTSEGSMVLTVTFHILGGDKGGGKLAYK
jgi:hypothetical protein